MQSAPDLTLTEARFLVLEMTVAALIAQLPLSSLEEVAGMLCFVAGATEETEEIASDPGAGQLRDVRHWASQLLDRIMVSRKAQRAELPVLP